MVGNSKILVILTKPDGAYIKVMHVCPARVVHDFRSDYSHIVLARGFSKLHGELDSVESAELVSMGVIVEPFVMLFNALPRCDARILI